MDQNYKYQNESKFIYSVHSYGAQTRIVKCGESFFRPELMQLLQMKQVFIVELKS